LNVERLVQVMLLDDFLELFLCDPLRICNVDRRRVTDGTREDEDDDTDPYKNRYRQQNSAHDESKEAGRHAMLTSRRPSRQGYLID